MMIKQTLKYKCMKFNKPIFLLSIPFFFLMGCIKDVSNQMSEDYPENYDIEYGIRQVLQYDPVNINGIDISKKMDFFSSLKFGLHYEEGKIVRVTYSNGNVPFSPFNFDNESDFEVECELDTNVFPNELRVKDTDRVIAYFQNGEFTMPFTLDCGSINYKYTFVNIKP